MCLIEKRKSKGNKNIILKIAMQNDNNKLIATLKILGRTTPPNGGERMRYIMFEKAVEINNLAELHSLLWPEINNNKALQGIYVILDELCSEAKK